MAKTVSFVIPALNEAGLLGKLLDSIDGLQQSDMIALRETIVVDARSNDETARIARDRGCRVVTAERGSVATSRNIGAADVDADVIAFVDADCELPTDWLLKIQRTMADDDVVAVGSSMAAPQTGATWVEKAWYELAHKAPASRESSEVRWLASFNVAVRRDAFEQIGGFDETLQTCEDVDLGYRLAGQGLLIRLNECRVAHHGESKTIGEFFRRESWRSRGSARSLAAHWRDVRELASFLLPLVVTSCLFLGLALVVGALASVTGGAGQMLLLAGVLLLIVPVGGLVLRRRVPMRGFGPSFALLVVYFVARTLGTIRPFPRVERAA